MIEFCVSCQDQCLHRFKEMITPDEYKKRLLNSKRLVKDCEDCIYYHESNDGCCHDCDPAMGTIPFCTFGKDGKVLGEWIELKDKVLCEKFKEDLNSIYVD